MFIQHNPPEGDLDYQRTYLEIQERLAVLEYLDKSGNYDFLSLYSCSNRKWFVLIVFYDTLEALTLPFLREKVEEPVFDGLKLVEKCLRADVSFGHRFPISHRVPLTRKGYECLSGKRHICLGTVYAH